MTVSSILMMTLTGSLVLLKLALIAVALILLTKAMFYASHPGSVDPNLAEAQLGKLADSGK